MAAFLFAAVAVVAIILITNARKRAVYEALAAAADELQLDYSPPGGTTGANIYGTRDGLSLNVESTTGDEAHTSFEVRGGRLPWNLGFAKKTLWASALSISYERVLTGDEEFDREVIAHGDEGTALAVLDAPTRRRTRAFVEAGGQVGGGKLTLRRGVMRNAAEIAAIAGHMFELAGKLVRLPAPKLLADNAAHDPQPAFRARCLKLLTDNFGDTEFAAHALQDALSAQRDPALQVFAAGKLRDEAAFQVLRKVVATSQIDTFTRVTALQTMIEAFGYEKASDSIKRALSSQKEELRTLAAHAVGEARDLTLLETLLSLPPAAAVAEALGKLGDVRAEPKLIELLKSPEDAVRIAAATALGSAGTVAAVEPLLPLSEGLLRGELGAAARDSIRRIQSKLVGAEGGRVSLAPPDAEAGAVSIAAAGGEVSRTPTKE